MAIPEHSIERGYYHAPSLLRDCLFSRRRVAPKSPC